MLTSKSKINNIIYVVSMNRKSNSASKFSTNNFICRFFSRNSFYVNNIFLMLFIIKKTRRLPQCIYMRVAVSPIFCFSKDNMILNGHCVEIKPWIARLFFFP